MLVQQRKARLREEARDRWGQPVPAEDLARKSISVQENFLSAFPPRPGAKIALYKAVRWEVDTDLVRERTLAAGGLPYYPRVDERMRLSFLPDGGPGGWVRGKYGLLEPRAEAGTEGIRDGFDLIVVPGMAFDENGRRLGMGYGYYDRFLSLLSGKTPVVGLAFSSQMVPEVPVESWDVPVDVVVTEHGVIRVSGERWRERP